VVDFYIPKRISFLQFFWWWPAVLQHPKNERGNKIFAHKTEQQTPYQGPAVR
jgi:hypothetical protein